jgi:hypothetical protein
VRPVSGGPRRAEVGSRIGNILAREPIPLAEQAFVLLLLAALAGGFALVLFTTMARMERRANWSRGEALKRSQRFQRRVFLVGVALVIAMVATVLTLQLTRTPRCLGTVTLARDSDGHARECVCEAGRRGACFEPGP